MKDNKKHYKFVHIFGSGELNFSGRLVKLINEEQNQFEREEHLFVTPFNEVYEKLKGIGNFKSVETTEKLTANLINYCASFSDWVFIHNICSTKEIFKIKRKYRKKIIWRTWGSDSGYDIKTGNFIKRTIKRFINFCVKQVVKSFYGIGIANATDRIDITNKYGNVKTFNIPYASRKISDTLIKLKDKVKKTDTVNILLGHSGFINDNHIEIMKHLLKFKEENIRIYLVLSYGVEDYINDVIEFAEKNFGSKAVIISKVLPFEEYIELLSKMTVAIFDGRRSYALGNVGIMLFFEKKFFINRNGIIEQAFDKEGIPHFCTDEIKNMSFEDFIKPVVYGENYNNDLKTRTYEEDINNWKKLIDILEKEKDLVEGKDVNRF